MAFGERAWRVNGILCLLFHAAFPWQVLLMLILITLIVPWVVQRRHSTWIGLIVIGLIVHAGFWAMGFLALAFGFCRSFLVRLCQIRSCSSRFA
jgi:hypothetical protein